MPGYRTTRGAALAALVLGLAIGGFACSVPRPQNVVVIVVDTLRADHLGVYGYSRETSPAIDALAADAVVYERAYSTAPWTMPSVASMLTGLSPNGHGLTRVEALPQEAVTLAEILGEQGYSTAAVVSHRLLGRRFQFDQGFEIFDETPSRVPARGIVAGRVTRSAQEIVRELATRDRPFFLFAHYFDPHYPYVPHEQYEFAPEGVGRLDGTESIEELRGLADDLSPEEVAFVRDLYDEEIRHTDEGIGRLVSTLRELDLYDNTLLVITADHGEEFLEHGWIGHTRTLYDELVRVPLLVRAGKAGEHGTRSSAVVSLSALAPTILEILGLEGSGYDFEAEPLPGVMPDGDTTSRDAVLTTVDYVPVMEKHAVKTTSKNALVAGRHKIIRDNLSGEIEVYDLNGDPGEMDNLAAGRVDLVRRLLPELEERHARSDLVPAQEEELDLPVELLEELRALGYAEQ